MDKFAETYLKLIKENTNIIKEYRVKKTFDCKGFIDWCKKNKLGRGEYIECSMRPTELYVHYSKTRYSQILGDEDNYNTQSYYNSFVFKNGRYEVSGKGMTGTGYVSSAQRKVLSWIQEFDPKFKLSIYIDAEITG